MNPDYLSDKVSWDRLQQTSASLNRKKRMDDGWMADVVMQLFSYVKILAEEKTISVNRPLCNLQHI